MKKFETIDKLRNKLNTNIFLSIFVTTFIVIIIIGIIFYFTFGTKIKVDEINKTKKDLETSSRYIELQLENINNMLNISNYILKEYFYDESSYNEQRIQKYFKNIKDNNDNVLDIKFISNKGKIISSSNNIEKMDLKIYNDLYNDTIKNNEKIFTVNTNDKNKFKLFFSKVILNNKEKIGIITVEIKYSLLAKYLNDYNTENSGDIVLLDENSNIVWYKNLRIFSDRYKMEEVMNKFNEKSIKNLAVSKKIANTDLTLLAIVPVEDTNYLLISLVELLILSAIIIIILSMGVIKTISGRFTRAIKAISEHMKNSQGNKKIEIDYMISTEIDTLIDEYNKQVDRIKYLRKYEIEVLHSQINPHFLYNTLDTIIWMAEFEDVDEVVKITKALSNFFRISLSNGKEIITLSDEIKHIKEYLYIQKQRYGEKLNYNINIFDNIDLNYIKVPKIIIQPIVENSIYHGIKNLDINGVIEINIRKSEEYNKMYIIEVIDNGIGFENKSSNNFKLGGIGIENVNKRLQYYYGNKAGVFIENVEKGSKVVLKIFNKYEY